MDSRLRRVDFVEYSQATAFEFCPEQSPIRQGIHVETSSTGEECCLQCGTAEFVCILGPLVAPRPCRSSSLVPGCVFVQFCNLWDFLCSALLCQSRGDHSAIMFRLTFHDSDRLCVEGGALQGSSAQTPSTVSCFCNAGLHRHD